MTVNEALVGNSQAAMSDDDENLLAPLIFKYQPGSGTGTHASLSPGTHNKRRAKNPSHPLSFSKLAI
jgi:hypothetical protein